MNTSLTDTHSKGTIKNILFLAAFWIGSYFVLTRVYKDKNEWTFEHILASIGITTVLVIVILLFAFFFSMSGLLIDKKITLACLFVLAWLTNKLVATTGITYHITKLGISFIGIAINIITLIKLVLNISNYNLITRWSN